MPRLSEAATFDRTISQLIARRRAYSEGLAQIDAIFAKYHIQVGNGAAPAAAKNPTSIRKQAAGRRKRRSFPQTADEFILTMLNNKQMTTREINAAWKRVGRGGTADNSLGRLVKQKQVKRAPVKDGRGSSYSTP